MEFCKLQAASGLDGCRPTSASSHYGGVPDGASPGMRGCSSGSAVGHS